MVKLAHIAVVTPGRCGLYETTREMVAALRKRGVDSRIYDPTRDKNPLHPSAVEDRGALFCNLDWAVRADMLVNHSGLGERLEKAAVPVIHVAHGRPHNSFISEVAGKTPIYSYHYHKSRDPRFRALVTFWPQHVPYHRVMWPDTPIHTIPPPVDLQRWHPEGPTGYRFHGMGGKVNVVCSDVWRDDVDPFAAIHGFALYARKHKGAKLHVYGNSKNLRGWSALFKRIQDDGNLGEVRGWVQGLANVYRAATMLITPHKIYVRSIREAMACGCPVAPMRGDNPERFAQDLEALDTVNRHRYRQAAEEMFDPDETARQFCNQVLGIHGTHFLRDRKKETA